MDMKCLDKTIVLYLFPVLVLFAGCVTQEKSVLEATNADFETVWVGYGAGGNYFYRLAVTSDGGDGVLIFQYDDTCRRYRIERRSIDFKRWTLSAILIPETGNEKIRLRGRLLSKELECEAQGPDWVYEVRLVREDVFLRNMKIATERQRDRPKAPLARPGGVNSHIQQMK